MLLLATQAGEAAPMQPARCSRGLVAAVVTSRRVCSVTPVVGSATANMAGWLRLSAGAGSTSGRLGLTYPSTTGAVQRCNH